MNELMKCPVFSSYVASRKLIKVYNNSLKKLDLTYPQYIVISVLLDKGNLSVDEIGKELFLDSGTLTPLLKRLENHGILMRQHSREDERKKLISLTPKGLLLKVSFHELRISMQKKFSMPKEEIAQLLGTLNTIIKKEIEL